MKKYITTEGTRVMLIHNMPFDAQYGLHQSEAELMQTGYLVEEVPEKYEGELPEDKAAELHFDGTDFSWIMVDKPPEPADPSAEIAALRELLQAQAAVLAELKTAQNTRIADLEATQNVILGVN